MSGMQQVSPNVTSVIQGLQNVRCHGQFYCCIGTNDLLTPGTETQGRIDISVRRGDFLKEIALCLSHRVDNGPVVAEVYGRSGAGSADGDLIVLVKTNDNRLCLLACHIKADSSKGAFVDIFAQTLERNPGALNRVMAVFDERFANRELTVNTQLPIQHLDRTIEIKEIEDTFTKQPRVVWQFVADRSSK